MSTTAWHYTAPDRRADVVKHVAKELWKLVIAAPGGSDQQFQLVTAYLATVRRATPSSPSTRRASSTAR